MNSQGLGARLVRGRNTDSEDGFSVVEAMVALGVASMLILMLSASLASGMNAALSTKIQQKATALGDEVLEAARDVPYTNLAIKSCNDCPNNGELVTPGPGLNKEPLIVRTEGALPYRDTVSIAETTYTVRRFVTWVDANIQGGPARDQKRVVVVVEWPSNGERHVYRVSTLVTDTPRGSAPASLSLTLEDGPATEGDEVTMTFTLENRDIQDTFQLWFEPQDEETDLDDWDIDLFEDTTGDGQGDTPLIMNADNRHITRPVPINDTVSLVAVATPAEEGTYSLALHVESSQGSERSARLPVTITVGETE